MNEFERQRMEVQRYKAEYPPGTRIVLNVMGNDPRPIKPGTRGTVKVVDSLGTLHCDFDDGRRFSVIPGEDSFRALTEEEIEEEVNSGPVQKM